MKKILNSPLVRRSTDFLLSPLTLLGSVWFKYIRTGKSSKMPISEAIFMKVGTLPVNDHYYQPLTNPAKHLQNPLDQPRPLPGIEWNTQEQLELLRQFNFVDELERIPRRQADANRYEYYYDNSSFLAGDAEFLYNMIRHFRPKRVIEIGCGYSTMMAVKAQKRNKELNPSDSCEHICIEPYEMPWLEQLEIKVIRKKVEEIDKELFKNLDVNDILFIDSSHIIRPQGDVLFEFLEVLPLLRPGVIVHVHDIFSPRDYPREWIHEKHCMWNEQYLLEAFLCFNDKFRILGALNYLKHSYPNEFNKVCPNSGRSLADEPGSFWMIRS